MEKGIEESIKLIAERLEDKEKRQDALIPLTRQVVRECATSIKAMHAGNLTSAKEHLSLAGKGLDELKRLNSGLEATGAVAPQEFVEASCLMAVYEKKPLPKQDELGIDDLAYLNGLADCVGELRRELQLALRRGDATEAERYYDAMDAIYENLMVLRFSSSLVGGLKRKQDVARGQLEGARSELLRK